MKDHLIIGAAADGAIRVYACITTEVLENARLIHDTWPTATAALGRVLTGAVMMGVMSDASERSIVRLTIEFIGKGPAGKILAVSNKRGVVKGFMENPHADLELNKFGKLDVGGLVGKGRLSVVKDLGLKEPYVGVVPLQSGEIGDDFAYYFTKSEQTPSAVALGVLINPDGTVRVAGGLIVQLMPGINDNIIDDIELKLKELTSLTEVLDAGVTPLGLFNKISAGLGENKVLEELALEYQCDCSFDRFRGPLLTLDSKEINDIIKEQGRVEVKCQFCNKTYHYNKSELNV